MLIHINKHYYARGKTGKGRFAARLVRAWREMGIEVTEDQNAKADIALHIGRVNYSSKAKKHVLRVGPANIDTNMNWKKINHEKAQSVKMVDAVVYQSRYSKKIYHRLVCRPDKPETIIFNGADPRDYSNVEPYTSNFKYNFIASTRVWLKQKRLKYIIRAFLEADIDDSYLIVCGDNQGIGKKYDHHDNILFIGPVSDKVLARLYKLCYAMIHLTYVDACPNSVVEAQVAGLPVICTDQGGTYEVLRYGRILEDKQFKYNPINLDKPPEIDRGMLVQTICKSLTWNFDKELAKDLYIDNIASQYLKFFERLL